jgi:aspergillopepsin I
MVSFKTFVTALALSGAVAAAPTKTTGTKFSIDQVAVKKPHVPPVVHYARALAKFKSEIPAHVASAAASAQSGSATNTPENGDEEYVVSVGVGDSTVNLDFDTGSADL